MNINEAERLLREEILKALNIGLDIKEIDTKIHIMNDSSCFACIHTARKPCKIEINKIYLKNGSENEIRSTLIHEVCHAIKGSKGHDKLWKQAVKKVKKNYSYGGYEEYHLCEHPYSKDRKAPDGLKITKLRLESDNKYKLICNECKYEWNYKRKSSILNSIIKTKDDDSTEKEIISRKSKCTCDCGSHNFTIKVLI